MVALAGLIVLVYHSYDPKPLGREIISKPVIIFGLLIVLCMPLIVKHLLFGLSSVSDLNGGFSWGVWIAFEPIDRHWFCLWRLEAGMGGICLLTVGQYHLLVRQACLVIRWVACRSLSTSVVTGTYRISIFWATLNVNAVLFETAVCMTIYIVIMALEFALALFERLGWKVSPNCLNKVMFFIIAIIALLPTMHQSSMGSL